MAGLGSVLVSFFGTIYVICFLIVFGFSFPPLHIYYHFLLYLAASGVALLVIGVAYTTGLPEVRSKLSSVMYAHAWISLVSAYTYTIMTAACGCQQCDCISDTFSRFCDFRCFGGMAATVGWLHTLTVIQFIALSRPAFRPAWYCVVVSWPAAFYCTFIMLLTPWLIFLPTIPPPVSAFLLIIPAFFAAVAVLVSLVFSNWREVHVDMFFSDQIERVVRYAKGARARPIRRGQDDQYIKIIQLSDVLLGPFITVDMVREKCIHIAKKEPDLVLITGDLVTDEALGSADELYKALSPLINLAEAARVFACLGNHDCDPAKFQMIRDTYERLNITLLINEAVLVPTNAGMVQLIGIQHHFDAAIRAETMVDICKQYKPVPDHFRIIMVHDPAAFNDIPMDDGSFVLAGHTYGGFIGLPKFNAARAVGLPDYGMWAHGKNRMYVHSGWGSPFVAGTQLARLGCSPELSVLFIHVNEDKKPSGATVEKTNKLGAGRPSGTKKKSVEVSEEASSEEESAAKKSESNDNPSGEEDSDDKKKKAKESAKKESKKESKKSSKKSSKESKADKGSGSKPAKAASVDEDPAEWSMLSSSHN